MQRFFLSFSIPAILFFALINWSCTKIDTTSIGQDLIPAVDNVNTFADTLTIITGQGEFKDSTRISNTDNQTLGCITNDPIFGKTRAEVFVEMKPSFFPYYFGNAGDTINAVVHPEPGGSGFDSAVLCLSVKTLYGDSVKPHKFYVYKIDKDVTGFRDSSYLLSYHPAIVPGAIGEATIIPTAIRNITHFPGSRNDSVTNQIRIKLSESFLNELVANIDTSSSTSIFRSDSLFKNFMRGFAIQSAELPGSNALFYATLNTVNTRLEVHYKKIKNAALDTTYSSFYFSTESSSSVSSSAHANYLSRDYSASEMTNSPSKDALYLQTTPGSFATLKIPRLSTFQNSIVHRAEVIIEQIPAATPSLAELDAVLAPPQYLYLDLVDSNSSNSFKPIYYDLNPVVPYFPDNNILFFPIGGINFGYFGGLVNKKTDATGNSINFYSFNISRYVQNLITRGTYNYTLRLYAPYQLNYYDSKFSFKNQLANGRIKVGSGINANYKLRMRIVYSKI